MGDKPTKPTKRYSITFAHFPAERWEATTASAARYNAFKALKEAGYEVGFDAFIKGASIMCFGRTDA